jgi:bis(5'-nucleosyl)-tetraphosphatase (symmetrical)
VDHPAGRKTRAREVESRNSTGTTTGFFKLVKNMFGDKPGLVTGAGPAWTATARSSTSSPECGTARPRGRIGFDAQGQNRAPRSTGHVPLVFECPARANRDLKVVFGHWSTLGLFIGQGVHAH